MNFVNYMIDIETLGRIPDAVIVQIACVQFDPMTGETGEEFSINVDAKECQSYGLTIDADTVKFWLEQSREAHQAVFFKPTHLSLDEIFDLLHSFFDEIEFKERIVWANSPAFDLVILNNALKKLEFKEMWQFRNERDFRTISKLFPDIAETHERKGVAHNGLDDCKNQISILSKCFQRIYSKNTEGGINSVK